MTSLIRRHLRISAWLFVCLGSLVTLVWASSTAFAGVPLGSEQAQVALASPTASCTPGPGQVVSTPYFNGQTGLSDVVAISASDIWSVGTQTTDFSESRGVFLHWNGVGWTSVPGPAGLQNYTLAAVDGVAWNDIWAVGGAGGTLALHWDGTQWSQVPTPNRNYVYLEAVDAISTNDVWAVGYSSDGNSAANFAMHWDGLQWSIVETPNSSTSNYLHAISGIASNDVWAVGEANQNQQAVALHWDGTQWASVFVPQVGLGGNILFSVGMVSTNDVWAMGVALSGPSSVILHWDGTAWYATPTPLITGIPRDIKVITANNIWAVGNQGPQMGGPSIVAHWDGVQWLPVAIPAGLRSDGLRGVTASSAGDVWAVGTYAPSFYQQPLVLRYAEAPCGEPTHTPTSTSTPRPTPPVCGVGSNYVTIQSIGTTVPGTTLVPGSQCSGCTVSITLPFTYYLYGQPYNSVVAGSNGVINFAGVQNDPFNACLPDPGSQIAIFPYWDHLDTSAAIDPGLGIYTSITGSAPNRVFNIEWRACHYAGGTCGGHISFEARLYEGQAKFDIVLGQQDSANGSATLGVQGDAPAGLYTSEGCDIAGATEGATWTYSIEDCATATLTVTGTPPASTSSPTVYSTHTPTATPTLTPSVTPTATPACGLAWRQFPAPDLGVIENDVLGIQALSATDIWSVGTFRGGNTPYQAFAMHWNGAQWDTYTEQVPNNSALKSLAAISPDNVWAAGYSYSNMGVYRALIEHWNGTSWSVVSVPDPGAANGLYGITATASNDVWAAGFQVVNNIHATLVLHWDGQTWSVVSSPNPGSLGTDLYSIKAITADDAWAVGSASNSFENYQGITFHWDGTTWSDVSTGAYVVPLQAVDGIGASDVWAVGSFGSTETGTVLRWDGSQWAPVPLPHTAGFETLNGIKVIADNDVWAAGYKFDAGAGRDHRLLYHWDGSAWTESAAPDPGPGRNVLNAITAVDSNEVWAAGSVGSLSHTFVLRYSAPCTTSTPTVAATYSPVSSATLSPTRTTVYTSTPTLTFTATEVSGSATSTIAAQSQTPTPTATATHTAQVTSTPFACTIQFVDAPQGSTFYPYVRCLACLGIINGYPCGGAGEPCDAGNNPYFRPSNPVTRGQLSKIVSNSAGFSEAQPAQLFEDVPVGSTFHDYVGRLAARNYIGGYPCGGAGEPCGTGDIPYFRPNSNATRGQISKIVANAAGFSDPPGTQLFEDVAPGSTFYDYVERLASRGIINGYPCGGAGEPCGPGNLPYFRTNNSATRGQTSKIVSSAFFPDCQAFGGVNR